MPISSAALGAESNPAYDALAMVIAFTDPDPEPILGVRDELDPNPNRDARPRPDDGAQDVSQDPSAVPE